MDKNKITSNDVLEALSIRINDVLRPESKKKENKKNNIFFWIFKFILLAIYILMIEWVFHSVRELGVITIYGFGKTLRSVISLIWCNTLNFMKALLIVYLLYEQFKIFSESSYYKNLYKKEDKMFEKKENITAVIRFILKAFAVLFLIITGAFSALSLFGLIYLIIMFINGSYMISPIIIMLSIFVIGYFTFKFIQNKFFDSKAEISKTHYIISFMVLVLGICLFGYEISSFEHKSTLPLGFDVIKKEQTYKINEQQQIELTNDSKLNNIKVLVDNELTDEVRVEFEYYKTADVKVIYELNEFDDLKLTFTSDLNCEIEDFRDVLKLFMSTFNNKTIYNYNLFKYPNIYVYVNANDLNKVKLY